MINRNGLYKLGMTSAAIGLMLSSHSASAVVLAEYNFTGNSALSTDTEASTAASAVTFTEWTDYSGYPGGDTPVISGDTFISRASVTNTSATVGIDSLADAIAADNFIKFTITGTGFDITSISFNYDATMPSSYSMSAHLLTDATGAVSQESTTISGSSGDVDVVATANTASDWQGLNSITVQIYLSDSTTDGGALHRIDSIVVEGTPEPGSLALLALGGIFVSWRRRRA